jgi:protein-disulfide isomerase
MIRTTLRPAMIGLALPLALTLAACGGSEEAAPTSGEPIARIAAPAGKQWSEVIAKTEEGGYRMGNPDAPLKVVEYGALSCSHCADFSGQAFPTLAEEHVDSGRVSYELRFYMLNVLDVPSYLLATCVSPDSAIPLAEQFWAWQPQLFQNLQANQSQMEQIGSLPRQQQIPAIAQATGMIDFFASRGIARDQAQACLADTAKAQALADATEKAATQDNITGTPTFLLNGSNIGTMTWPDLNDRLQKAGSR